MFLKKPKNKCENKIELEIYDVSTKYTNKQFSQKFVDCLGSVMYNSFPLKIHVFDHFTFKSNNINYIKITLLKLGYYE